MYGLGVDISTGIGIQPTSHLCGVRLTPGAISYVLHILPVTQGTRIYIIWFRSGDLNKFRDIQPISHIYGVGLTPGGHI
jgi:hypothetical protein